jgi:hypothetical protein
MQQQIAELERQRAALLQELDAAQEFWAYVESTLTTHRVRGVRDLPSDMRRLLFERLAKLPHEGQTQLELIRPERKKAEVTALLAQHPASAA